MNRLHTTAFTYMTTNARIKNSYYTINWNTRFLYSASHKAHHWPDPKVTDCTMKGNNSTECIFDNFMISSMQYLKRMPMPRTNYHDIGLRSDLSKPQCNIQEFINSKSFIICTNFVNVKPSSTLYQIST